MNIFGRAFIYFDVDDLEGVEELKTALDKFNEQNGKFLSYFPDYKKVVILEKK